MPELETIHKPTEAELIAELEGTPGVLGMIDKWRIYEKDKRDAEQANKNTGVLLRFTVGRIAVKEWSYMVWCYLKAHPDKSAIAIPRHFNISPAYFRQLRLEWAEEWEIMRKHIIEVEAEDKAFLMEE